MYDRSILPKIRKIQESIKRISGNTQTTSEFDLVNKKDKVPAISTPIKIVETKT